MADPKTTALAYRSALYLIRELLRMAPNGLSGKVLMDVLTEMGVDQDDASRAVRNCLNRGILSLNSEMRFVYD